MSVEPGWTIRCDEVVELITDYLEGQLDEPTRVELEAHLALCPGCAEYLRQMRLTIQALGHVALDSLSDAAKTELLTAFRDFPAAGKSRP
jgi:anti-sigma factor RsiW